MAKTLIKRSQVTVDFVRDAVDGRKRFYEFLGEINKGDYLELFSTPADGPGGPESEAEGAVVVVSAVRESVGRPRLIAWRVALPFRKPDRDRSAARKKNELLWVIALLDSETGAAVPVEILSKVVGLTGPETDAYLSFLAEEKAVENREDFGVRCVILKMKGRLMFEDMAAPVARTAPIPGPVSIQESLARFKVDHPEETKTAFIMMRFGQTASHQKITGAVRSALAPHGIEALRADDKQYHDELFANVQTYIHGCGFGIAVLERIESDEFNPNVSLEVGYMIALNKPVCLLKDRTLRTLNTDLVGRLYRSFDTFDPAVTIPGELGKWLSDKDFI